VVLSVNNKLDKIIRLGKDISNDMEKTGVVYKINAKSCHTTYIGETKRSLQFRVNEHKN